MPTRIFSFVVLLGALFGVALAHQQPVPDKAKAPPTPEGELDPLGKQTAALEAQLAKLSSSTKEGAELQLKLIDLYHENARPFGLIRTAQSFVSQHSTHPRHKEVLLKLIDGLQATGRNKELIATGRQFLVRHPADPASAQIELWMVPLLRRSNDYPSTAALQESHWKRLGATPDGYRAGREAVGL